MAKPPLLRMNWSIQLPDITTPKKRSSYSMNKRRTSIIDRLCARSRKRRFAHAGKLLASLGLGLMCSGFHLAAQPVVVDDKLEVRTIVDGLVTPASLAFIGPNDFLVLEKNTGRVQRVKDGAIHSTVLALGVNTASERGTLGIALHPDFPGNPGVYIYWTESTSGTVSSVLAEVPLLGNRVDRFKWDGSTLTFDHNIIRLRAAQPAFAFPPFGPDDAETARGNHDGGVIKFGADGKLYIFIGDVGRRGWMQNVFEGKGPNGNDDQFGGPEPDDAHLTGVILRLNDDGSSPEDNPFYSAGQALGGEVGINIQKVFSYGHRNSFGFDFDPESGSLWLGENGDDSYAEINRVLPGMNAGWIQIRGPVKRVADYKAIETSEQFFGLQQRRWPPTLIADTPEDAVNRLFMLPGAHYSDPVLSWRFVIEPAALGFLNSRELGPQYQGDLFLGGARDLIEGGHLFRMKLTGNRRDIAGKQIVDNLAKWDITGSEKFLFGSGFGVVTDIQTAPNGNLVVLSLSHGAVYQIASSRPRTRNFVAPADGSQEVPPNESKARGNATFKLNKDGTELSYKLTVANLHNITQAHIHLGAAGVNGSVVAWLYPSAPPSHLIPGRSSGVLAEGTITSANLVGPLAGKTLSDLLDLMRAEATYINVHTSQFPPGEIRGQIRPSGH
jgi:aldose sugar dehydrogenase